MTDIEAKKRARTAFANELYDRSGGSESFYEHYQVIRDAVGLNEWEDASNTDWLLTSLPPSRKEYGSGGSEGPLDRPRIDRPCAFGSSSVFGPMSAVRELTDANAQPE